MLLQGQEYPWSQNSGKHCLALRRKVAFLHRQNTCKGLFCSGKCAVPAERERVETSLLQNHASCHILKSRFSNKTKKLMAECEFRMRLSYQ